MFRKKTVDGVIAAFNKAKEELHALAEELAEQARNKRAFAESVMAEAASHTEESERARRIADRVHALTQ